MASRGTVRISRPPTVSLPYLTGVSAVVCRFELKKINSGPVSCTAFCGKRKRFFSTKGAAMSHRVRARKGQSTKAGFLQKPTGRFTHRVQAVGPEHFAVVSVDCAKA